MRLDLQVRVRTLVIGALFLGVLIGEAFVNTLAPDWQAPAIGLGLACTYMLGQWSKSP